MSPAKSNGRYSQCCLCCWPGGSTLSTPCPASLTQSCRAPSISHRASLGGPEPPSFSRRPLCMSPWPRPPCPEASAGRGENRKIPRVRSSGDEVFMSKFRTLPPRQSFSVKSLILVSNRQRPFGGCRSRAVSVNNYRHFVSRSTSNSSTSFSTHPRAQGLGADGAHGVGKNQQRLSDGTRSRWGEGAGPGRRVVGDTHLAVEFGSNCNKA